MGGSIYKYRVRVHPQKYKKSKIMINFSPYSHPYDNFFFLHPQGKCTPLAFALAPPLATVPLCMDGAEVRGFFRSACEDLFHKHSARGYVTPTGRVFFIIICFHGNHILPEKHICSVSIKPPLFIKVSTSSRPILQIPGLFIYIQNSR